MSRLSVSDACRIEIDISRYVLYSQIRKENYIDENAEVFSKRMVQLVSMSTSGKRCKDSKYPMHFSIRSNVAYKPRHEKTNKMNVRPANRSAWTSAQSDHESSLSA